MCLLKPNANEVFIRPVASTGGRKRLSSEGGIGPEWRPRGRELFFIRGGDLVAIRLDQHHDTVGRDRSLFTAPRFEDLQFEPWGADVMPDGEHFVFDLSPQPSSGGHYNVNVVLTWFKELKRRPLHR